MTATILREDAAPWLVPQSPPCCPGAVETWAPIPGWPHEASDHARVRTPRGRILTKRLHNGYWHVDLWDPREPCRRAPNGRWQHLKPGCRCKKTVTVGWCVKSAHDKPRPYEGLQVRHGDAGSQDDHLANLEKEWGPQSWNELDKDPELRVWAAKTARASQLRLPAPPRPVLGASPRPGWRDRLATTLRGNRRSNDRSLTGNKVAGKSRISDNRFEQSGDIFGAQADAGPYARVPNGYSTTDVHAA